MPLDSGTALFLRARQSTKAGNVGNRPLDALLQVLADEAGAPNQDSNPQLVVPANAVSETSQTLKASSGKLFFVRLVSPSTANDDAIVSFFDNSVLRFAVRVKQTQAIEVPIFGSNNGCGLEFDTNLTVTGKKVDNSSNLDAPDRPTLEVLLT